MKQIISFKPHSFIDIITNSSSEMFICNTEKEVEEVKELLIELLEKFNELTLASRQATIEKYRKKYGNQGGDYYNKNAEPYVFEECFGNIYKITKDNVDAFVKEYILSWWAFALPDFKDAGIPRPPDPFEVEKQFLKEQGWEYLHIYYKETAPAEEKKRAQRETDKRRKLFNKYLDKAWKDWDKEYGAAVRKLLIGRIIIESKEDNSVPYDLWDTINNTFAGVNYHLG